MLDAEIIAVGGGLAGAAFALELARNGCDVLILESTRGAHHKVCGEFLSIEARRLLGYLGINIHALGASSVDTLRLAAGEHVATAPLPFLASGLSRYRLDDALLTAAVQAGARIVRGERVTGLDIGREGTVVAHSNGRRYRGQAVALATGKHALRGVPRPVSDKVAFKLQVRVGPAASQLMNRCVQLVAFEDGYIGACSIEDGCVTICWVMREKLLKRIGARWSEQANYFARQSNQLSALLKDAEPVWEKPVAVAGIPYGFLRHRVIAPNVFPIGDQLAVIPSYTGDGNAIALFSGVAAAQTWLAGQEAESFQADMMRRLRPQFRWATTVNLMFEYHLGQRLGIALAAHRPGIVTRIAQSTRLRGFEHVLRSEMLTQPGA